MRKLLLCVPMMTLLLLVACSGGRGGVSEAEELALTIRGEYLAMQTWSANAEVTADYGRRVYQYRMTADWDGEEAVMVLSAPDTVAGITARMKGKDGLLEYDGMSVETGPMDQDGLTPLSAVPALVEAVRSGYLTACALEEGTLLRLDCGDPEGEPGQGREITLWLDPDTHVLKQGEIRVDGFRTISCVFSDFTKE